MAVVDYLIGYGEKRLGDVFQGLSGFPGIFEDFSGFWFGEPK
jgi:hypothetical protein